VANLVLFDIDGTLTDTNRVDNDCYIQAVREVLDGVEIESDWTRYPNVTDQGILVTLFERFKGRSPSSQESKRARSRFVELMREAQLRDSALIRPMAGANEMLCHLTARRDYCVALATGAWKESADLKLALAGLSRFSLEVTSSSDALSRESILSIAIERERLRSCIDRFASIVYVGDGCWDARAAKRLGLGFVGIASDDKASRLLAEGAECVIPDYKDKRAFFDALRRFYTSA
jgi:phosphoglycolate phosphatase-like HAD superfamily hydrolase